MRLESQVTAELSVSLFSASSRNLPEPFAALPVPVDSTSRS